MTTTTPSAHLPVTPLALHIHGPEEALPRGLELTTTAQAKAVLVHGANGLSAHLAVPERARAEQRWIVDHIVRRVSALARIGDITLHRGQGVDDDLVVTLGLDMHQRSKGRVTLHDMPELQRRVAALGALEDLYRDWVNQDPAQRTSLAIARDVCDFAGAHGTVSAQVLAERELARQGLRLLLAVGAGSKASPPRLVIARYQPEGGGQRGAPLMLLGKGITFDSGGINVKPYESYVSAMKNDMAGAALAFSLFRGLVESGYPEPLVLVLPTCENAIDANAMRPGAVVESYRGLTVRIDHTDAEGRLALADGLAYATDIHAPRQVLSFATLTTAALVAYGPYATPVHFADSGFEARLRAASERTGEDMHFFPERIWHFEANRDQEADLRNTARLPKDASRGAGSRNAAHFLKHFTDAPLCHFDIFASAWNWAGDAPGAAYGATGAPLRTLLHAFGAVRDTRGPDNKPTRSP